MAVTVLRTPHWWHNAKTAVPRTTHYCSKHRSNPYHRRQSEPGIPSRTCLGKTRTTSGKLVPSVHCVLPWYLDHTQTQTQNSLQCIAPSFRDYGESVNQAV